MNKYYASLVGPLLGCYFEVRAEDELTARRMLNASPLEKLWCSLYSLGGVREQIAKWGGQILPYRPLRFDYDAVYDDEVQ